MLTSSIALQAVVAVLSGLQIAAIVADLTLSHAKDASLSAVSAGLSLLSYIVAGCLHFYSHQRARRSSTTLLFFWLFTLFTSLVTLRTKLSFHLQHSSPTSFILLCACFALQLVIFSTECLRPDPGTGYIKLGDDEPTKEVPVV